MPTVSVRDLRNKGGRVLKRVARGESVTVTMDGEPIAELHPVRRPGISTEQLVARRRGLPSMDPRRLRHDIDTLLDTSL